MPIRSPSALLIVSLALAPLARAAEIADAHPPAQPASAAIDAYTFSELLSKAERIVVAEVGPMRDGELTLVVRDTIKAPELSEKYVDPDRLKRAAEMLANPKLEAAPLPSVPKTPPSLKLILQNVAPPREGVQAVFFLWESAGGTAREPAYRLNHPQCMYDIELLPQIRAGAAHPRTVGDGRFLRDWDKQMAERMRQREANAALLKMKGGDVVMGLKMRAARPRLSLRGNNSFGITAVVENTRARDQAIYDGPAGGYGIAIRPKEKKADGAGAIVLRQSTKSMGADVAVLNLTDITDFSTVPHESSLSKELFFDAQEFPILTTLQGEFTVSVFYMSTQDGHGLDIGAPVWTGAMISEEVPLKFESPMSQK